MSGRAMWQALLALGSAAVLSTASEYGTTPQPPVCTAELLADIEGFMVDLDGTMYGDLSKPSQGIDAFVDGALNLSNVLEEQDMPVVYLSNSACKGGNGVDAKFRQLGWPRGVGGLNRTWTASDGIAAYLMSKAPPGARVLLLDSTAYFDGQLDSCLRVVQRHVPKPMPWRLEVNLGSHEAKKWATSAAEGEPVFVVYCADGNTAEPDGGPAGPASFNAPLMMHANWLLENGATLVGECPDDFNPNMDPEFPKLQLWNPGPGPWTTWFKETSGMHDDSRIRVIGKGGSESNEFMFAPAVEKLQWQLGLNGKKIEPNRLAMVGDTLPTDIAGGQAFGAKTVFVTETGFNHLSDLKYFPGVSPTCYLPSVKELAAILHQSKNSKQQAKERVPGQLEQEFITLFS